MKLLEETRVAVTLLLTTTALVLSNNPSVYAIDIADSNVEEATTNDEVLSGPEDIDNTLEEETLVTNVTAGATNEIKDALIVNEESTSLSIGNVLYAGALQEHKDSLSEATDTVLVEDEVSNIGSVQSNELETNDLKAYITAIDHVQKFVSVGTLNVREQPDLDAEILTSLSTNTEVTVIGIANETEFLQVEYNGETGFVAGEYLSDEKIITVREDPITWNGEVLNSVNGTVNGPSGVETYYDLDMSKIVSIMNDYGYYNYTVDEDGVCRLDGYVMVAADLSIRPRGTILRCSRGMALVCDTGSFIYDNPTQLDIAVKGW